MPTLADFLCFGVADAFLALARGALQTANPRDTWLWELQDVSLSLVSVLGPEIADVGVEAAPLYTLQKVGDDFWP